MSGQGHSFRRRAPDWRRLKVSAAAVVFAGAALASLAQASGRGAEMGRWRVAQDTRAQPPRIAVGATVVAEPASRTPLSIRIGPTDAIPRNSFLQLRGLPPTASLSEGHAIAPGSWAIPLGGLPSLTLQVPASVSGRSELLINLVGQDGTLLAEARVTLLIPLQPPPAEQVKGGEPQPLAKQAPVPQTVDRGQAEKLIQRGERELQQGNVSLAREFFQRAAQLGLARGALLLAATYDPRELARLGAVGVQPNVAEARKWYERAQELGAAEASDRLVALGSSR